MLQNKDFKITTGITRLFIFDKEKVYELFESKEGYFKMIKDINKLYGTKIKKILYIFHDVCGYNIFYTE